VKENVWRNIVERKQLGSLEKRAIFLAAKYPLKTCQHHGCCSTAGEENILRKISEEARAALEEEKLYLNMKSPEEV